MQKTSCIALIILYVCFFVCFAGTGLGADKQILSKKIASVNGKNIFLKDFKWALDSEEKYLISSGENLDPEAKNRLRQKVFEMLINRELLYQESQKQNIEIEQTMIDEELDRIRYATSSDVDLETIEEELGMNENDLKMEFRRVFAIHALMEQVVDKTGAVTENDMKTYYDKNMDKFTIPGPTRVSHILVLVGNDFTDEQKLAARKKIEMVQQELVKGKDFTYLAKTYSEGPSNSKGGDIGYIKVGKTVKAFEDAALALKAGEISDIIETKYGYHIIKVTDKKPETVFAYENIKNHIEAFIRQERAQELELAYIFKLKKDAKIEIFADPTTLTW